MSTIQITLWINRLSRFLKPETFLSIVKESESIPDDRFFNDPAFKPLHEALAAGHLAFGLKQVLPDIEVKLNKPNLFPDFYLRINKREYSFEFTIANKPERKIGKEYKDHKSNPLLLTPYQPSRGQKEGPLWIAEAVKRKHSMNYSEHPHLLIYANFEAKILEPAVIANLCRQWSDAFSSIWIIWNKLLNNLQYLQLYDSDVFGKTDLSWHSCGLKL